MRIASIALAGATLLQATALGALAIGSIRLVQRPCIGSLERLRDDRSADELAKLPVIAKPIRRARTVRSSGLFGGTETTTDAEYQLGEYRVTSSMVSDRGRPGQCQIVIDRPDLCDGKPLTFEYVRFDGGFSSPLHRDVTRGVDVIVLTEAVQAPGQIAFVFRLTPGGSRSARRIVGGVAAGLGFVAFCIALAERARQRPVHSRLFFAALTLSIVGAVLAIVMIFTREAG